MRDDKSCWIVKIMKTEKIMYSFLKTNSSVSDLVDLVEIVVKNPTMFVHGQALA